jgi:hypothetical protein
VGDKTVGLIHKYDVQRVDGKPVGWVFVLEDKDPLTIPALRAYADAAELAGYGPLAADLRLKARELARRVYAEAGGPAPSWERPAPSWERWMADPPHTWSGPPETPKNTWPAEPT